MCEISDETPIFRIYNLYDLINTLSTGTIRLSQASRMEDTNELFGIYFGLLGSSFGPPNTEFLDKTQKNFQKAQSHHYMTCWTRTYENIAVWSLYSPGRDAVQVCTTYGKLRDAVEEHFRKNSYALAYSLEPNDPRNLFYPPDSGPITYVDFNSAYSRIRQECVDYFRERDSWIDAKAEDREPLAISEELSEVISRAKLWLEQKDEVKARIFQEPRLSGPLLKDLRYQHEQEVRFILALTRRDGRSKEEYEAHPLAGLDDSSRHPKSQDCPPNIFVSFAASNFSNVQVDGRIEEYKYEAICHILNKFGIKVSKSNTFNQIDI